MFIPQIFFNFFLSCVIAASTSIDQGYPDRTVFKTETAGIVFAVLFLGGFSFFLYNREMDLMRAIDDGSLSRVKLSVYLGSDINQGNYYGLTPLHLAVRNNQFDIARFLLRENAFVDVLTNRGESVLDCALKEKNKELFLCLLLYGATIVNRESNDFFMSNNVVDPVSMMNLINHYTVNYKTNNQQLLKLIKRKFFTETYYKEKLCDMIGFALRHNDFDGLDYCVEKKRFSYEDIIMAIADNKQLTQHLPRYIEKMNLKTWNPRSVYDYAKQEGNKKFMNTLKYYGALRLSTLRKKVGDSAIIQHILSYVPCE